MASRTAEKSTVTILAVGFHKSRGTPRISIESVDAIFLSLLGQPHPTLIIAIPSHM